MEKKKIVIVLGILILLVGLALTAVTEPAGGPGSTPSFGIADVSEDTRPYLWHGVFLILGGIAVILIGAAKL